MLEKVWRKGNPLTLLVAMQTVIATMENSVEIPLKTGNRTALWPSNPTAEYTHQGNQNWKRHMYPNVHLSTVYNSQAWKQPRCPSADKWMRKLWYIYTMEYYSAIKNNTFESVLMRWMKMESIIQSEVSQKGKHQYSISSVQFSRSVMSDSLRPHESQHARPPCPSPTPGVHSDSCPSS